MIFMLPTPDPAHTIIYIMENAKPTPRKLHHPRVVVLVDMDCFYVQVEQRKDPSLKEHPCAVVQYQNWQGGSIIAVDYRARQYGVSRMTRGNEAWKLCPDIRLVKVPEKRGKADLTCYREAGAQVISILARFADRVERASIDEAFLDITERVAQRLRELGPTAITPDMLSATHVAGLYPSGGPDSPLGPTEGECSANPLGTEDDDFDFQGDLTTDEIDGEVSEEEADGNPGSIQSASSKVDLPKVVGSPGSIQSASSKVDLPSASGSSEDNQQWHREELLSNWLAGEGAGEERCLAVGAVIAREMRMAVWKEAGFSCSAGIAHNKVLAKLAAGMNKPNQQTILPMSSVPAVFSTTPFKKIRHLGGKLGLEVQRRFGIKNVGEIQEQPLASLRRAFGDKTGSWLYDLCRGIDRELVKTRTLPQSIGCGKNFPGPAKLKTAQQVLHWLEQLVEEVRERLAHDQKQNSRRAELLTVHFHPEESQSSLSRSFPLHSCDTPTLVRSVWAAINKGHPAPRSVDATGSTPLGWTSGLTNLSLAASRFSLCPRPGSSVTLHSLLARNRTACAEASSGPAQVCDPLVEVGKDALPTSRQQDVLPDHHGSLADWQTPRGVDGKKRDCGSPGIKRYFVAEDSLEHQSPVEGTGPLKRHRTASCRYDGGGEGECELCVQCQHWVPLDVWQEHSDFHLAQDLQKELEEGTEDI